MMMIRNGMGQTAISRLCAEEGPCRMKADTQVSQYEAQLSPANCAETMRAEAVAQKTPRAGNYFLRSDILRNSA